MDWGSRLLFQVAVEEIQDFVVVLLKTLAMLGTRDDGQGGVYPFVLQRLVEIGVIFDPLGGLILIPDANIERRIVGGNVADG